MKDTDTIGGWSNYRVYNGVSFPGGIADFLSKWGNPAHLPKNQIQCKGCGARKWLEDGRRCAYCKSGAAHVSESYEFVPIRYQAGPAWPYGF